MPGAKTFYLLYVTPFRRLLLAQAVSLLGDFVAVFAVQVAVVFRMHGSAADMAGVFIASLLPTALLGPLAGVFTDRWNPRRVMIASDVTRAVLVLLLGFANSLSQIYAISFLVSCASGFFSPAQSIAVPMLVAHEKLASAAASMQQTMQIVRIASPSVAAALVAAFGERSCYWADSVSFLLSAMLIGTLRLPRTKGDGHLLSAENRILSELTAGLRFLFTDPRFSFVALAMTAGAFAAGCFGALASLYVRDVIHSNTAVFGMMGSLIGVGTVAGSSMMKSLAHTREPESVIGYGMAGVGFSIFAIAAAPFRSAALLGSLGIGLGVAMVLVASTVMLQGKTPPELRGRVSAATGSLASLAQLGAMLFSASLASWIGIRGVFLLSATMLLLVSLGAARVHPSAGEVSAALPRKVFP